MKIFFVFLLFSFSSYAIEDMVLKNIYSIDRGSSSKDDVMVMLTTGEVLWIRPDEKKLLHKIQEAYERNSFQKSFFRNQYQDNPLPYVPTVVKTEEELKELFMQARRTSKSETQCFNRAHIWTYEWRINHNIYSSKAWLFFTRNFIRKYKFDWWFHVAPLVAVQLGDRVIERILDIKYANSPLKEKHWTDIFVRDNADCPVVSRYSDYADYPESGSCFVMKTPMYYYRPIDLEDLELSGNQKTKWIRGEVREAYREAFDKDF